MRGAHLLKQTITIKNRSGSDVHGKPDLGTGTDYKARVERTRKTITTAQREREPIDAIIFVASATVAPGDQITYSTQTYRVMAVQDIVDGNGDVDHRELLCQLWSYA